MLRLALNEVLSVRNGRAGAMRRVALGCLGASAPRLTPKNRAGYTQDIDSTPHLRGGGYSHLRGEIGSFHGVFTPHLRGETIRKCGVGLCLFAVPLPTPAT